MATDTGDDAKDLRQQLRWRAIRAQLPKRFWATKKPRGRPINVDVARFQADRRDTGRLAARDCRTEAVMRDWRSALAGLFLARRAGGSPG
jgi:hypothetical protein